MITGMPITFSGKNKPFAAHILLLFIPCLFFIKTFWSISHDAISSLANFQRAQGQYHQLRTMIPIWKKTQIVQSAIPPGSSIQTSLPNLTLEQVAARYILYPLSVSNDWDYFIDFHSSINTPDPSWHKYPIKDDITIFAKARHPPPFSLPIQTIPSGTPISIFLGTLIWMTTIGFLTLQCLQITLYPAGRSWYLAASYAIGFLLGTGTLWIVLLAGYHLNATTVLSVWAGLFLILAWLRVWQWPAVSLAPSSTPWQGLSSKDTGVLSVLFWVVISLCLISMTLKPVVSWDAMSHWVLKARVLFHHQTLDFADTHHNYYPILWPLHIAAQFILTGQAADEIAQWLTGTLFLCFLGFLKGGLHQWALSLKQQVLLLLLFIAFFYQELFFGVATAENGYLVFFTGTVTSLMRWHHSGHHRSAGELVLIILFATGLSLFKLEGAVTSLLLGLSLLLLYRHDLISFRKEWFLICGFLTSAGLAVLWITWIKHHNFYHSIVHFQEAFSINKLLIMLSTLGKIFLRYHLWLILLMVFFYGRYNPHPRAWDMQERLLLYISLGLLIFSSFANAGWPAYRLETLMMESFPRLFYHALPALFFLWTSRAFR
jgi:hypothetical protein